ncbi:MAG: twin-arginine translocation signal domain-containing protein [Cyclobacteriaceae bacterium]
MNTDDNTPHSSGITRRDILKGLATVPVLGGFVIGASAKQSYDKEV